MQVKAIHQIHRCPTGKGPAVIVTPGTVFECGEAEYGDLVRLGAVEPVEPVEPVAGKTVEPELPLEPAALESDVPDETLRDMHAAFAKFDHDGDGKPGGSLPKVKRGAKAKASRAKAEAARAAKSADTDDLI